MKDTGKDTRIRLISRNASPFSIIFAFSFVIEPWARSQVSLVHGRPSRGCGGCETRVLAARQQRGPCPELSTPRVCHPSHRARRPGHPNGPTLADKKKNKKSEFDDFFDKKEEGAGWMTGVSAMALDDEKKSSEAGAAEAGTL